MLYKYLLVAGVSAGAGYYVAHRRLEQKFFTDLARETDEARDFYRRQYMKKAQEDGEAESVTQAAVDAAEALSRYSGIDVGPSVLTQEMAAAVERASELVELTDEEVADSDVLKEDPEASDESMYKEVSEPSAIARTAARKKASQVEYNKLFGSEEAEDIPEQRLDDPAKITEEQFIKNELGYTQMSLTYFIGDDVLANASDEVLDAIARKASLGEDILKDLTVGGTGPIYVRNNAERWEFDISRSAGKYSVEVGNETE